MRIGKIGKKHWGRYQKLIQKFLNEESGLKPISWLRHVSQPLPFGEDVGSCYFQETLNVLINYNVYRTWPINMVTPSGEIDNETLCIIMPNDALAENGFLDEHGYFSFDLSNDRFIIDGISYKSSGDTQYSQASDVELVTMVVLKRLKHEVKEKYTILPKEIETPPIGQEEE